MAEIVVQRQPGAYNARDLAAFVATCSDDVALYRAKSGTPLALLAACNSVLCACDERVEAVVARVLEDGLIQRVWLFHAD